MSPLSPGQQQPREKRRRRRRQRLQHFPPLVISLGLVIVISAGVSFHIRYRFSIRRENQRLVHQNSHHIFPEEEGAEGRGEDGSIFARDLPYVETVPTGRESRSAMSGLDAAILWKENQKTTTENIFSHVPLNDPTIVLDWDPAIKRFWWSLQEEEHEEVHNQNTNRRATGSEQRPKAQLLLTNFGWNHPNTSQGLSHPRSHYSRQLLKGIINHPWFHPTAWEDLQKDPTRIDPNVHYYVFLDVDTCFEVNWPVYAAHPSNTRYEINCDTAHERRTQPRWGTDCWDIHSCPALDNAWASPLLSGSRFRATIVYFHCNCRQLHPREDRHNITASKPLAVASMSATVATPSREQEDTTNYWFHHGDQGLVAPPVRRVRLSREQERANFMDCVEEARDYFFTFVGNTRSTIRRELARLNNAASGILISDYWILANLNISYEELLRRSLFAAAPRGDCHYSYRFAEVLSSGAIPVVHSDGWQLPFRQELIDWSECAVILPEKEANNTVRVLQNMNADERCRRRKKCREIYQSFFVTPEKIIAGLIEGLELAVAQNEETARTVFSGDM